MSRSNICISFKISALCSKRPHDTREKNKCVKRRIINENCYFLANRQLTLMLLCGNETFYRRKRRAGFILIHMQDTQSMFIFTFLFCIVKLKQVYTTSLFFLVDKFIESTLHYLKYLIYFCLFSI